MKNFQLLRTSIQSRPRPIGRSNKTRCAFILSLISHKAWISPILFPLKIDGLLNGGTDILFKIFNKCANKRSVQVRIVHWQLRNSCSCRVLLRVSGQAYGRVLFATLPDILSTTMADTNSCFRWWATRPGIIAITMYDVHQALFRRVLDKKPLLPISMLTTVFFYYFISTNNGCVYEC